MTQWAEIRHLHLVEGVSKKQIARRLQLDIKTVRRALEQPTPPARASSPRVRRPGPVAGADRAVAGPGPAVDGEADSAAAVAAGRAGRRAHGAPVCGGVEGGDGTEGGLRAPQRASWDDDGGRLRRIVGRGRGSAAEGQVPGGDAALQQRVFRQGVSARAARVAARRDRVGVHVFRRCYRPGGARQHVVGGQGGAGRPGPA